MKALIIIEQFKEFDSGPYCNLVKPFEAAFENDENYEMIVRRIAPDDIWSPKELSKVLLETEYDVAVVSPLWHVHVELETAKKVGKKLFIILWDSGTAPQFWSHIPVITSNREINFRIFLRTKPIVGHNFKHSCYEYSEFCNIIITDYGMYGQEYFPNIYSMNAPVDSRIFYPVSEEEKEFEISFFGQINTEEREFYMDNLRKLNYPIHYFGNQMDWPEFADKHRKSKMVLALNSHKNPKHLFRKGKIFEAAACGNFAFVSGPEVYNYKNGQNFTDGEHYKTINFDNYLDVIDHYMKNDDERIKLAKQLHEHYVNNYSEKPFWNNIFKWSKL